MGRAGDGDDARERKSGGWEVFRGKRRKRRVLQARSHRVRAEGMMVSSGSFLFLLFLSISRPDELAAPTPPPILSQGGNFSCVMYTCVNVVYRCWRNPRPVGEVSNRPHAQKLLPPKPTHPARHITPQGPPKTERPTTGYFQKRRFISSSNHHLDHRI